MIIDSTNLIDAFGIQILISEKVFGLFHNSIKTQIGDLLQHLHLTTLMHPFE